MMLLDGKKIAGDIRKEIKEEVATLIGAGKVTRAPSLSVILVGEDPASQVYVRNKEKACTEAGIISVAHRLPKETTQEELLALIDTLNADDTVDGILLQLPLPAGLDSESCLLRIAPHKDVDGFHPVNMGNLTLGLPGFKPCTPHGVMVLLERYNLKVAGKKAVVVGRSNIVGKPLALMLGAATPQGNATVTTCHSRTPDMREVCKEADFLFLAIGKPNFITADMVKPGAVIVDVGINRTPEGLVGDCDFASVKDIVSAITPVPGGIGPMTIAMLLVNAVEAYKKNMQV